MFARVKFRETGNLIINTDDIVCIDEDGWVLLREKGDLRLYSPEERENLIKLLNVQGEDSGENKGKVNTRINYLYRDADNYKKYQSVIVKGEFTSCQILEMESLLNEGMYFIPRQVGLPEVRFPEPSSADHCWFEWEGTETTADDPTEEITAAELYKNFEKVAGKWDDVTFAIIVPEEVWS